MTVLSNRSQQFKCQDTTVASNHSERLTFAVINFNPRTTKIYFCIQIANHVAVFNGPNLFTLVLNQRPEFKIRLRLKSEAISTSCKVYSHLSKSQKINPQNARNGAMLKD
jgi:hypothetical protein